MDVVPAFHLGKEDGEEWVAQKKRVRFGNLAAIGSIDLKMVRQSKTSSDGAKR